MGVLPSYTDRVGLLGAGLTARSLRESLPAGTS